MTTMRTYTCTNCGASLATSAPPGTTVTCQYCSTPFEVPPPSLDQPGDSQATVVASFRPRGNPSAMPPTGPDGEPASTPERPPAPDSPAGVGNTVDSDAGQPMVGRGEVEEASAAGEAEPIAERGAEPADEPLPPPPPAPSVAPEPHTPQIIEELDAPEAVADADTAPEPEPDPEPAHALPPVEEAPAPVPPVAAEPVTPEVIPVPEGVSAADILAEPTKHGINIPAEQGEPVLVAPDRIEIVPPQTPVAGGPPGAAMRSGNRTPMLIGGLLLLLCCLLTACALLVGAIPGLIATLSGA